VNKEEYITKLRAKIEELEGKQIGRIEYFTEKEEMSPTSKRASDDHELDQQNSMKTTELLLLDLDNIKKKVFDDQNEGEKQPPKLVFDLSKSSQTTT